MALRESGAKAVYLTPQVPQQTTQHENLGNRTARSTYRPSSHLSQTHLEMEGSTGVYQHFHAPYNSANRFLASATDANEAAYRDIPRRPPPPFSSPDRPLSAPHPPMYTPEERTRLTQAVAGAGMTMTASLTTPTGAPSFLIPAIVDADIEDGQPMMHSNGDPEQTWRVARVQAYAVPAHKMGYGEGGARPFHQDYRHYKYYGFAGKGAKTSWGHNPKLNKLNVATTTLTAEATVDAVELLRAPLVDETTGQRRALTPLEKKLIKEYRAEGVPSGAVRANPTAGKLKYDSQQVIDPYKANVDIITRKKVQIPGKTTLAAMRAEGGNPAHVVTYRSPAPSAYTMEHNNSPNMGSQSPFHQRYNHYKYQGFAGKGATSSWARNPKYAHLAEA